MTDKLPPRRTGRSRGAARPARRGCDRQRPRRRAEQTARGSAVELGRDLTGRGRRWAEIAGWLHVTDRTLRRWCRGTVQARPLGRPASRPSRDDRNTVIHFLDEYGPHVGVPLLRTRFPVMSRAEVTDLLTRYRRVWRKRNRVPLRVLSWSVVGSVWAIDFTGPRSPIEGRYPYLVAARDLASGRQLLWRPVEATTGEVARDALAALFAEHGAPLVLKCDNGSPFTSAWLRELLADHGVAALYSPPGWPRYNGSVEAGIGSLKHRTDAWAARAGHAGEWTWDDVAGACAEANAVSRPRGGAGRSPDDLWSERRAVTAAERAAFRSAVAQAYASDPSVLAPCVDGSAVVRSERAMARDAIRLALETCGYLHYTRRSIPPPI